MAVDIDSCVAHHIGDRHEQQDRASVFAHRVRRGAFMAVLADGMGGHTGGAMASEQVVLKAMQSFDLFAPQSESPQVLLASIINEAHVVIRLTRFTSEKDPHSTAAVLMVQPDRVDWAHCGDSRIYHFSGEQLVSRTDDHSMVAEMVRRGQLTEDEAAVHNQRNVLLSCLGSDRQPEIKFGGLPKLVQGDSFLLCSDGLWAYFSDAELGQVIAWNSARAAAQWLIDEARVRAHGTGDNISVIIIKILEDRRKLGQAPATN